MINIYSPEEISKIRQGGEILAGVLQKVLSRVSPGITTRQLDEYADQLISQAHGQPSFKMEKGYRFATCMNVNDMVVHGIPTDYKLRNGDRLGVDVGIFFQGFHTDASWSVAVGHPERAERVEGSLQEFLEVGKRALSLAIDKCRPGNRIGDISKTIQDTVEEGRYSCVKQLVGHGVGRLLHEDPEIPCYLRGQIENTPEIKKGMVLAIEVIYNQGESGVVYANDDGWTIVARDGLFSGLFEHTVAVAENGSEILTLAKRRGSRV